MAFKSGDSVWAKCSYHALNLTGRQPATIVSKVGVIGRLFWKLEGDYFVEIVGRRCPNRRNGVPAGMWLAWETELTPRKESDRVALEEAAAHAVPPSTHHVEYTEVAPMRNTRVVLPRPSNVERSWGDAE